MSRAPLLVFIVFMGACVGSLGADDDDAFQPSGTTDDAGVTPGGGPTDLPCEVVTALSTCTSCHGSKPIGGAPFPLVTRADLTRTSPDNPAQTVAQRCVERMKSTTAPMPPKPAAPSSASDIASLEAWIASGSPAGTCASADAGPSPYDTPVKCTSGMKWSLGDEGSPDMHPGRACLSCHATNIDAPRYPIAGTVYPSAHEPDDCASVLAGPATVVVTDSRGAVFRMTVGPRGNFYYASETPVFTPPYTAKVVYQGRERAMTTQQTNADCNSCHTQSGTNGAPGRILLP